MTHIVSQLIVLKSVNTSGEQFKSLQKSPKITPPVKVKGIKNNKKKPTNIPICNAIFMYLLIVNLFP